MLITVVNAVVALRRGAVVVADPWLGDGLAWTTAAPLAGIEWIRRPQSVEPGNVMPDMAVSERDADDIAAFLYTLR